MHVRFLKLIALLAVALFAFAACGDDSDSGDDAGGNDQAQEEPAESPEAEETPEEEGGETTFTAVDYGFQGPDTLPAGEVQLTLENEGTEPHEMAIIRFEQGKTLEDALAFIKEQGVEGKPPPWAKFVGGIRPVKPGESGQGGANLEPGSYALLCFVESKANKGQPHVALGMAAPLTVE
ncbi:MAG: hypothetical protein M3285_13565 [Actinomycetota bacterium]|nr:hypothetical protein [Actinomycetota bacterium]